MKSIAQYLTNVRQPYPGILLHGGESFKDEVNLPFLNATVDFVLSTNRFDEPLYIL